MDADFTLKGLSDENSLLMDKIQTVSRTFRGKEGRKPENASKWTENISKLSTNLAGQSEQAKVLSKALQEEEEERSQCLRDKWSFLIQKLKSDITFFASCLQEFIDPPDGGPGAEAEASQWDYYIHQVDQELKQVPARVEVIGDVEAITNIAPLQSLLNMRDELLAKMLKGVLYQKAVLDWDIGAKRDFADSNIMVEMYDVVVNAYSNKTQGLHSIPNKLQTSLGSGAPPKSGPYCKKSTLNHLSGNKSKSAKQAEDVSLDTFTATYHATLREFLRLDKLVRKFYFGSGVCQVESSGGVSVKAQDLRQEISTWYKKCVAMDHELQVLKAARHTHLSSQVEQLQQKLESKEDQFRRVSREKAFLETDIARLSNERTDLAQKLKEINERYTRLSTQTVPKLDKLNELVENSVNAVRVLQADSELLSAILLEQVAETEGEKSKRDSVSKETKNVHELYRKEVRKNQLMQEEMKKKEILIVRAMGARKEMQEAYHARGEELMAVEETIKSAETKKQEMMKTIEEYKSEILKGQTDLGKQMQRVDELEQVTAFLIKKLATLDPRNPFMLEYVNLRAPQKPAAEPPLSIERSGPIDLGLKSPRK